MSSLIWIYSEKLIFLFLALLRAEYLGQTCIKKCSVRSDFSVGHSFSSFKLNPLIRRMDLPKLKESFSANYNKGDSVKLAYTKVTLTWRHTLKIYVKVFCVTGKGLSGELSSMQTGLIVTSCLLL